MLKQNRKRKHENHIKDVNNDELSTRRSKFRPFDEAAQKEEEQLSQILFGGASNFLRSLEEAEQEAGSSTANIDSGVGEEDSDSTSEVERKPAWVDEDDDGIDVGNALDIQGRRLPKGGINSRSNKYSNLLEQKFKSVVGTPKWASLNKKDKIDDSDSDDEILQTCGFIKKTPKINLPSGTLELKKVKDLNRETYNEGPFINVVEFHPTSSVALVAGNAGIASLYVVDGKRNNKLHSVAFDHYSIICGKFTPDGNEAILGSRHSHIFSYDLIGAKAIRIPLPTGLTQCKNFVISPDSRFIAVCGKWGEVYLLTKDSKEKIAVLKQDSHVTALTFNPNGNLLYGHSDTGAVTIWDINMRRVKNKWCDEGCLQGTTLAVATSDQFVATGSAQGVVNLYGVEDVLQCKIPKPRKSIFNLTTGITDLKFNASSEILGFCSTDLENSVKLYHVNSGKVFNNFPRFGTNFGHVNVLNFSPGSGYVGFGNKKSVVSLYRLEHYKNY